MYRTQEPPIPAATRGLLAILGTCLLVFCACETVPITGRQAFNTFSIPQDVEIGREAYAELLRELPLVRSGKRRQQIERVMSRLVEVSDDRGFEWEVNLIDDDETVNAFALPGGKMAVYSGLLPVAGDDAGLAVVMGHEIGHVVARHSTERLARSVPASILLDYFDLQETALLAAAVIDLALNRPHGRIQESEADAIGLIYMARAGYDPRRALEFWRRMQEQSPDGGPDDLFELLSTHPSHERRLRDLEARLPEALAVWRSAQSQDP